MLLAAAKIQNKNSKKMIWMLLFGGALPSVRPSFRPSERLPGERERRAVMGVHCTHAWWYNILFIFSDLFRLQTMCTDLQKKKFNVERSCTTRGKNVTRKLFCGQHFQDAGPFLYVVIRVLFVKVICRN